METLNGQVKKIRYRNDENGYTIMAVISNLSPSPLTVIGNVIEIREGDSIHVGGKWINHKKYGRQFQSTYIEVAPPSDKKGIIAFLAATVKGIGKARARLIVEKFGKNTISIMDNHPERLKEVSGITERGIKAITESWDEGRTMRETMIWLQKYGVTPGYAVKIWKAYGDKTMHILTENPYRIADEIWGMGFKIADAIALKLGVPKDSPLRIKASILYTLKTVAENDGHLYLKEEVLTEKVTEYVDFQQMNLALQGADSIDRKVDSTYNSTLHDFFDILAKEKRIVMDHDDDDIPIIYHTMYHHMEENAAKRIVEISTAVKNKLNVNITEFTDQYCNKKKIALSNEQKEALKYAAGKSGLMAITGLPGTGKTSVCKAILDLYDKAKLNYFLTAPTGRASERLSEVTGRPAMTIHRLLGWKGITFDRNKDNPLECDAILIDESSMMDIMLFNSLLEAIKKGTRLILIGDIAQLPSVGPGDVLKDVIRSGGATIIKLKKIFRQAETSPIVANAHRINEGLPPLPEEKFQIIKAEQETIASELIKIVPALVQHYGDVQVLCPMNKGSAGVHNINTTLQAILNPPSYEKTEMERGFLKLRTGDRIIQLKNNYKKDVYNGSIGHITAIDSKEETIHADFNGKAVEYDFDELEEIRLAYCISIHKSQGSEFKCVILCMVNAHYIMLRRKLLYTAVTRAREECLLIGNKKAIHMAVRNINEVERNTRLAIRVQERIAEILK